MFPLPLFSVTSDVLETMDARQSLQHINTFMKNALIRGVNNINDLAPRVVENELVHFLHYATVVCEILSLHAKGDQLFFNSKNSQGTSLALFLGIEDSMNQEFSKLLDATSTFQQCLKSWINAPGNYSYTTLRSSLNNLAMSMLSGMTNQRLALSQDNLMRFCSAEVEMQKMIHGNLTWLTSGIDISILLPFVLSHHDQSTSVHWPGVSPEGLQLVPGFVEQDPKCWCFGPFDPITQKRCSPGRLLNVL